MFEVGAPRWVLWVKDVDKREEDARDLDHAVEEERIVTEERVEPDHGSECHAYVVRHHERLAKTLDEEPGWDVP